MDEGETHFREIFFSIWGFTCVVGMTSGACHGPSYLLAGIPGVSMALGREDRLHPKGRLRQQPAGDSTEESQSRAMKIKASQQLFR
jgi:hypothetical protein